MAAVSKTFANFSRPLTDSDPGKVVLTLGRSGWPSKRVASRRKGVRMNLRELLARTKLWRTNMIADDDGNQPASMTTKRLCLERFHLFARHHFDQT